LAGFTELDEREVASIDTDYPAKPIRPRALTSVVPPSGAQLSPDRSGWTMEVKS
jgi:hypothetical protein